MDLSSDESIRRSNTPSVLPILTKDNLGESLEVISLAVKYLSPTSTVYLDTLKVEEEIKALHTRSEIPNEEEIEQLQQKIDELLASNLVEFWTAHRAYVSSFRQNFLPYLGTSNEFLADDR